MKKDKEMAQKPMMTMPEPPEPEPSVTISWPGKGVKLDAAAGTLGQDVKVRVVVEGTVKGFGLHDYGGNVDVKTASVSVVKLAKDAKGAKTMTEEMAGIHAKRKRAAGDED